MTHSILFEEHHWICAKLMQVRRVADLIYEAINYGVELRQIVRDSLCLTDVLSFIK